jgi:hypothetical protein
MLKTEAEGLVRPTSSRIQDVADELAQLASQLPPRAAQRWTAACSEALGITVRPSIRRSRDSVVGLHGDTCIVVDSYLAL